MADVTISQLESGKPSNSALIPYSESGVTKATTVSNFGVPIGAVFHLATSTVPTGYLKCNGDTVPNGSGTIQGVTANFSALYTALGSTYGSAGKLPDLRGEFVRGFDDGRGIDTSRVFGSTQTDDLKSHVHTTVQMIGDNNVDGVDSTTTRSGDHHNQTRNTGAAGGTETRPRNVALMPVIKY
jgi:microcystin-dependent protein